MPSQKRFAKPIPDFGARLEVALGVQFFEHPVFKDRLAQYKTRILDELDLHTEYFEKAKALLSKCEDGLSQRTMENDVRVAVNSTSGWAERKRFCNSAR